MSVAVACLGPAPTTVSAGKWGFVLVKSYVVFKAAKLTESLFAGWFFACPNAIHSVRGLVFLVVNDVVGKFASLELIGHLFFLDHFAQRWWHNFSRRNSA